jgi:hypothetical protein
LEAAIKIESWLKSQTRSGSGEPLLRNASDYNDVKGDFQRDLIAEVREGSLIIDEDVDFKEELTIHSNPTPQRSAETSPPIEPKYTPPASPVPKSQILPQGRAELVTPSEQVFSNLVDLAKAPSSPKVQQIPLSPKIQQTPSPPKAQQAPSSPKVLQAPASPKVEQAHFSPNLLPVVPVAELGEVQNENFDLESKPSTTAEQKTASEEDNLDPKEADDIDAQIESMTIADMDSSLLELEAIGDWTNDL